MLAARCQNSLFLFVLNVLRFDRYYLTYTYMDIRINTHINMHAHVHVHVHKHVHVHADVYVNVDVYEDADIDEYVH